MSAKGSGCHRRAPLVLPFVDLLNYVSVGMSGRPRAQSAVQRGDFAPGVLVRLKSTVASTLLHCTALHCGRKAVGPSILTAYGQAALGFSATRARRNTGGHHRCRVQTPSSSSST